ncbi:MAG: Rrf2 family transcriptional regulator [Coriobacteriia bacterium]|nr:Rrf2 family transcriptional regulator [Coriobacteriia bacterium]
MRVPQSLDYAVRALVLLALQPPGEFIAAGELADHLGLPRRFVEQQITALSRAGIVNCRRGASGGCALARPSKDVSVFDIVRAVQGEVLDVPRVTGSAASALWQEAADELGRHLQGVTLEDLAKRQRELDGSAASMYWI